MAAVLPPLRMDLDFMPSPVEDRPGLLVRDPMGYSDATLIIPPVLVPMLACFDGEQTELDLRQQLVQATGQLDVGGLQEHLLGALNQAGFLDNEEFARQKDETQRRFAEASVREPSHAGSAYPEDREELAEVCQMWMTEPAEAAAPSGKGKLLGIAAPHVSPIGGWGTYQAAFRALGDQRGRTFVVLGTSHYGVPDRFGLTRKGYETPFGTARPALNLIDELARKAPDSIQMEDYCHAVEHSIEFQIVFLQHLFGPDIEVLPVLCGSFVRSLYEGGLPERNENVQRFFDALGEIGAREGEKLTWVLGVDMAHMGTRYQDQLIAEANAGEMLKVAALDKERMASINRGDAREYWAQVQEQQDPLKWCGSSPFYTFLKTNPNLQGETLRYEQWNIDPQSVVSFAAMAFYRG